MIASRKAEKLDAAISKLKKDLDAGCSDNIRMQQCNIRKEDEVFQSIDINTEPLMPSPNGLWPNNRMNRYIYKWYN